MKKLPYRAETRTGDRFDIEFPLHAQTGDPVRVAQVLSVVLDAIDQDLTLCGETSNGDVLQAVAMAMAIRARMIHGAPPTVERLSAELLRTALDAVAEAEHHGPQVGRA